jgi:predicted RNA binding protein YcfA (HicA-like mRNA interferase family)
VKLPRDIRGADLIACLCRDWGYVKVNQVGSYVVLETDHPSRHRIVVPAHNPLRVGTLNAILRAIANHKGVRREEILSSL